MATKQEKLKIAQALEKRLRSQLPDMEIVLGKGHGADVRVYVLSQKWRRIPRDPNTLIREALHDELSDDPAILKISYCWPMTPKEYEKLKGTPYYAERNGELVVKRTKLAV